MQPQNYHSLFNLGWLLLQKGQSKLALEPLKKASLISPSHQCSALLAQSYQNLERISDAITEYSKINMNQIENKQLAYNYGKCLVRASKWNEAIQAFDVAIRIDSKFTEALESKASIEAKMERYQAALLTTQKILDINVQNPAAHLNLGKIHMKQGSLNAALESTLRSIKFMENNPEAYSVLGIIYKELGNYKLALSATHESIKLNPSNPYTFLNLGAIHKDQGNYDKAIEYTNKSLSLKPENALAYLNLGAIHKEKGDLDMFLTYTRRSIELDPNSPEAYLNMSIGFKDLGDIDTSIDYIHKALELKPNDYNAYLSLASIHKDKGSLEEALSFVHRSIELNTKNSSAFLVLSEIYYLKEDYLMAEKAIDESINLSPRENMIYLNMKAACLFKKKKYYESIKLLESANNFNSSNERNLSHIDAAIKASKYAICRQNITNKQSIDSISKHSLNRIEVEMHKITFRPVEESLLVKLKQLKMENLSSTRDARYGNGYCTDFSLFRNKSGEIQKLRQDLEDIIADVTGKSPCSLKYDSFFNVFKSGAGTEPHSYKAERW